MLHNSISPHITSHRFMLLNGSFQPSQTKPSTYLTHLRFFSLSSRGITNTRLALIQFSNLLNNLIAFRKEEKRKRKEKKRIKYIFTITCTKSFFCLFEMVT